LGQSLLNLLLQQKQQYDVIGFSRGENRSGRDDFYMFLSTSQIKFY
jgi:dTDP-4-dehydrorhamnose reductase